MARVRVPVHRTSPTQSVLIDPAATVGAQIGVNLLLPDGTVGTIAKLAALFGSTATAGSGALTTTDDLEEGQWNLWFTNRRAQDAVGGILANSANVTLAYVGGTSITADLTSLTDSGAGVLLATTFDAKGRKTGSRAATITGTTGRVTVTNGDASAGLPTIDLATVADAGGGTLQKTAFDAYGRKTGTSAATTTDLAEGTNLYFTDARADARITLQKAQPLGLATLDAAGKLDAGQLPALAITETFVVNTQAAMLALSAQEGDVAVRTDLSKSFILTAAPPSTLANWQELLTPMSPVTSVFGRTGPVVAAMGDYTPAQVGAEPAITAGTTSQYRRGDKTWRDLATDVRAAVLTGLSTATSAVIAATDTVLSALGKLQAQITDNLLPPGYIDGLQMQWVSSTAITVSSGAAYIEGSSKVLRSINAIAKTGLSLTASAFYHVYLYSNAGTPDIEIVTTAPAAAYNGTARSKTGDASRRYVGSIKTASSGSILSFEYVGAGEVWYRESTSSNFRVLSAGLATTKTAVSVSQAVPSTSRLAFGRATNTTIAYLLLDTPDAATGLASLGDCMNRLPSGYETCLSLPLDASQRFSYAVQDNSSGGAYMDIVGYRYQR